MSGELLQLNGEYGPVFELRPPWTVALVKDEDNGAVPGGTPWLCRIRHRWQRIGDVWTSTDCDRIVESVINLARTRDIAYLSRCKRCGDLATRSRF